MNTVKQIDNLITYVSSEEAPSKGFIIESLQNIYSLALNDSKDIVERNRDMDILKQKVENLQDQVKNLLDIRDEMAKHIPTSQDSLDELAKLQDGVIKGDITLQDAADSK